MLYTGEKVGFGDGLDFDIAVDPIDGTSCVAGGRPNGIAAVGISLAGTMFDPGHSYYCEKLVVGPEAANVIDLDAPVKDNLINVAKALGKKVGDLKVFVLDKPRHDKLINDIHNAVGAHEVLDSSTFFQELGIGRHVKLDFHLSSGEFFGNDCLHFLSSANGNCAFGDEHDIVIHVLSDLTRDLQDVTEVCGTVFIGRRADCAEDSLHLIQTVGQTGCEFQTPLTEVSHNHFFQSGLIDGHFPFGKHFYFFFVDVHAGHFNAHLGETCTGNKADVTGANDSYFHKTLKMFS